MRIQIQLRIVAEDESVISDDTELLLLDKSDDRLEALGLSLAEAQTLLAGVQQTLVRARAASFAARHRDCPVCGRRRRSKGPYPIVFRTAFGTVPLASPRFHRCGCHPTGEHAEAWGGDQAAAGIGSSLSLTGRAGYHLANRSRSVP